MADNQKHSCPKCGCPEYDYDSYYKEYSCKECGFIVEDQMKISELNRIRVSHSQKKRTPPKPKGGVTDYREGDKGNQMALTGVQIFKLLPKTNCKECGVPTCLAFAMNLASGKAELDACPYVSDEAREQLAEASAPPTKKQLPKFFRQVKDGKKTYELYTGDDVETAKSFLTQKTVDKPLYYVQVKTPQGVWGVDVEGLYLTDLLDWQKNLSLAQYEGQIVGFPSMFNVGTAAKGIADNFVVKVKCGKESCGHEWMDALRYQSETVVRCPICSVYVKIDSNHIHYVEPGLR